MKNPRAMLTALASPMLLMMALGLCGCGAFSFTKLSPEDAARQNYLDAIAKEPRDFDIPVTQADDAWGRALSFIGAHSAAPIQLSTDTVIKTAPVGPWRFSYQVTRAKIGDHYAFTVHGAYLDSGASLTARDNVNMLAHYVKTGELPYPDLIFK